MAAARLNQVYFWKKYLVNDYIVRGDIANNQEPRTTDSCQQQPFRKRKVSQETDSSKGNTSSFSMSVPKIMTSRDAP